MCSGRVAGGRLFWVALTLMICMPPRLAAQTAAVDLYDNQAVGVCYQQPDMTERELRKALEAMRAIVDKKGRLSAEEEEALINGEKLTSDRLNCLMGKVMASNDVFEWGRAEDYGVPLTAKEIRIAKKYKKDSLMLKRYMEEVLNVRLE